MLELLRQGGSVSIERLLRLLHGVYAERERLRLAGLRYHPAK